MPGAKDAVTEGFGSGKMPDSIQFPSPEPFVWSVGTTLGLEKDVSWVDNLDISESPLQGLGCSDSQDPISVE